MKNKSYAEIKIELCKTAEISAISLQRPGGTKYKGPADKMQEDHRRRCTDEHDFLRSPI